MKSLPAAKISILGVEELHWESSTEYKEGYVLPMSGRGWISEKMAPGGGTVSLTGLILPEPSKHKQPKETISGEPLNYSPKPLTGNKLRDAVSRNGNPDSGEVPPMMSWKILLKVKFKYPSKIL